MHLRHWLVGLILSCASPGFAQNATPSGTEQEKAQASVPAKDTGKEPAQEQTKPSTDGRPKPTGSATPP